jgi:hypothetical protein
VSVLGAVVDWDALLQVVWASAAAGIGVTLAASTAIVGGARFADARRDGNPFGQAAFGLLTAIGVLAICACVVLGIVVMTDK